ncbi:zinc finger fyve/phd-type [Holotrichia oblita]|uniref:Zinc finger fyve/phd-type n=1 Tax=Holotrichia oblita TaxID=644536 RepID=A0ACB9TMY5_HOLOL|nr:zinc finger fyve/phd-type [Holotrichia oblita]
MKISYSAQIFSHHVASGLHRMSIDKSQNLDGTVTIPVEAADTAYMLQFFDDLFDIIIDVNGRPHAHSEIVRDCSVKPLRKMVHSTSPHSRFWRSAIKHLQHYQFVNMDGRQVPSPPSLKNWIFTLQSILLVQKELSDREDIENPSVESIPIIVGVPQNLEDQFTTDDSVIGYISGYISKVISEDLNKCNICMLNVMGNPTDSAIHALTSMREYNRNDPVLNYPTLQSPCN